MTTEERLEKLERELAAAKRRILCLPVVVGLAVVGAGLAWVSAVPKVIRANEFILEDADGKSRITLALTELGAGLVLSDENGKIRATLALTELGPVLGLVDENGQPRARLATLKDGPGLTLYDESGKDRARLAVNKDGPSLGLYDENGKPIKGISHDNADAGTASTAKKE